MIRKRIPMVVVLGSLAACVHADVSPPRMPMTVDGDMSSVSVRCRHRGTEKDPKHITCAPAVYETPTYWDVGDNLVFRPVSHGLHLTTSDESVNVNSLDEVPDSSWFENRIGAHDLTDTELTRGGCNAEDLLDPNSALDGSWVIDHGKGEGSQPGFRITVHKRHYLIKLEPKEEAERTSAASVLGIAIHHAVGYHTSCEQLLYVKPETFKLLPGLRSKTNVGDDKPFDKEALDAAFADAPHRDRRIRVIASAWLPGYLIGPFRYEGTRADDPNDVVPHEDRRDLRGLRLLAAWLSRYDSRSGNTLDSWIADHPAVPDSSPGHVMHYHLDTSETLGADPGGGDPFRRREGFSYIVDFHDMALDFLTLGIPTRPWDEAHQTPGREIFGYFNVEDFSPDHWKGEYPNPAFLRMTERDGAWMARILARFTRPRIHALVELASFTDPGASEYLERVLDGRLMRILDRYLLRLSPMTDARVEGDALCVTDLAETRGVREPAAFRFTAQPALSLRRRTGSRVCFELPAEWTAPDVSVVLDDGVAAGKLLVRMHDFGRGLIVTNVQRPEP